MCKGNSIAYDDRFLIVIVMSLSTSLSASFIGGTAAAKGSLSLPFAKEKPIEFSVFGGIAVFVILLIIGYLLYMQ